MDQVSLTVISEIAKREGVDPTELSPPLYEVVNPVALDELFTNRSGRRKETTGLVRFTYERYTITVTSDGEVRVSDANDG